MSSPTRILCVTVVSLLFSAAGYAADDGLAPTTAASDTGLQRLRYNNPGLVVELGVGLWGTPLPIADPARKQVDLFVSTMSKPDRFIYHFQRDASDSSGLRFRAGTRACPTASSLTLSRGTAGPRLTGIGVWYPGFPQKGLEDPRKIEYKPTFYCDRGRNNQWQFFDYDGDGMDDLVIGATDTRGFGSGYDSQGRWENNVAHGYVFWVKNLGTNDKPKYGSAQQVLAADKPMEVYGAPYPCLADFDGDGLPDIICGEFVDTFTFFKNIGTRSAPKFAEGVLLKNGPEVLHMDLCMIAPAAVDWDQDGKVDLLVGQEDGTVSLLRNTGKVSDGQPVFEPPVYLQQQADEVKVGVLSTPFAFDWNGDGRVDIICGDSAGHLAFIENLGGSPLRWAAPKFLQADGKTIRVQAGPNGSIQGPGECKWGYTVPCVVDWDMDGLPDILINSIWGKIEWYRNVGTRTAPKLAAAEPIEVEWPGETPKPPWNWWSPQGKALVTQWRSGIAAMDLTGDGLVDLVTLDPEGFLVLYERKKVGDKLVLLPPQRVFHVEKGAASVFDQIHNPLVFADNSGHNLLAGVDDKGDIAYVSVDRSAAKKVQRLDRKSHASGTLEDLETALRLNASWAGASGRRKFTFVDWDGDGKLDLLVNSTSVNFLKNVSTQPGRFVFRDMGPLDSKVLAGHDTCPTTGDIYGTGVPELIVGAEDGCFYHMADPNIPPRTTQKK